MARKKAHLVRNILLLTASSWWTFSAAWRRWLEPWCKVGAANVKAAPESAGGPGLSGLLLGAHFGLLCNRAPAPPRGVLLLGGMYCSGLRRDRFSSLVVDIGSGGARWPGGVLCETK